MFFQPLGRFLRAIRPHWHLASLAVGAGCAIVAVLLTSNPTNTHASVTNAVPASTGEPLPAVPVPDEPKTKPPEIETPKVAPQPTEWDKEVTVRSGDSLNVIFGRLGLQSSIPALLRLGAAAKPLHRLHPGQTLQVRQNDEGLIRLVYSPTPERETHYLRAPDGTFKVKHKNLPTVSRKRIVGNTIQQTLFESGYEAGLSAAKILELARIFSWDIDFALEIRKGDQFWVVWKEQWIKDRHVKDGPILAAKFVNQGKTYQALRYVDRNGRAGYYTLDGKPLRKQFLRTPVDFTRISSHFNPRRLHPVLKKVRPHRGVDYAAPTGTPVYATGDGVVKFRGWKGGYGRVIFIQHGNRYTTVYAHLSRYARGLRVGTKVAQGQYIGRVGMSGMATGPHLHYEFRADGVHRNPVRVTLPASRPVPLTDFYPQVWAMLLDLKFPGNIRTTYANAW